MADISSRPRAKERLRHLAISLSHRLLRFSSALYQMKEGPSVIIAPHQDDETLACGGLIARKRNEGLPVHVIFITDGAGSHPGHARFDPPAIAALRREEAFRAIACLGVERTAVYFLNEPDGSLNAIAADRREDLVSRLADHLKIISPAEIFLPCRPDGSSEHDATFGFVTDAIIQAQVHPEIWQYPVWSWWSPLLLLRRWLATKDCRQLPVEDFQIAKRRAIQCYQSQISPLAPETTAALPAGLVEIFKTNTEFFFRYKIPADPA